jgi:uncharacterized membrane protein YfcA
MAALIMLAGSVVLSTGGFGIGMMASPLLLLFLDPQSVVVMINTVALALTVLVLLQTRRSLPVREMTAVSVAGVAGVPLGVWVLSSANDSALRISITGLIILMALSLGLGTPRKIPVPRLLGPLVGLVVGMLVASLAIGGPLIVVFLLARDWTRHAVRASLSFYFLAIHSVSVVGYAMAGLFTPERLAAILVVAAPALLGFGLATFLVRRMNERRFRQGALAVIVLTSLMVLAREVLSL